MTRNLSITAIELEGFQCFEKPTRIEFAPITLLYGPNSAGKSAIFDALELAEEFWSPIDKNHEKFSSLVKRWTRRMNQHGDSRYHNLRIAIEFPLNLNWPFDPKAEITDLQTIDPELRRELEGKHGFYNLGEPGLFEVLDDGSASELSTIKKFHEELHHKNIRMEFVIRICERGNRNRGYSLERYSVHLGEQILIEGFSGVGLDAKYNPKDHYMGFEGVSVVRLYDWFYAGDPFQFHSITKGHDFPNFGDDPKVCRSRDELEKALHTGKFVCFYPDDEYDGPWDPYIPDEQIPKGWLPPKDADYFEVDEKNIGKFNVYTIKLIFENCPFSHIGLPYSDHADGRVNGIFAHFAALLTTRLRKHSQPIVSGNRKLPSTSELSQIVDLAKEPELDADEDSTKYFCHLLLRAAHASFLTKMLSKEPADSAEGDLISLLLGQRLSTTKLLEEVETAEKHRTTNRHQRHQLKLNYLSALTQEVELFKGSELFKAANLFLSNDLFQTKLYQFTSSSKLTFQFADDSESENTKGREAFVKLGLVDANQNHLAIEDVGLGIGYFLPCLVALLQTGLIRIQQPELHLHPGLQANIGDILIKTTVTTEDSQLICETHSEHLLLRIMKRIRQQWHSITYEDVIAYYFDPISTSSELSELGSETIVTKQEISPSGDFVHRWPKGFFEERWQELSDD